MSGLLVLLLRYEKSTPSARSAQSAQSARSAVCSLHGLRFNVTGLKTTLESTPAFLYLMEVPAQEPLVPEPLGSLKVHAGPFSRR